MFIIMPLCEQDFSKKFRMDFLTIWEEICLGRGIIRLDYAESHHI